MRFNRNNTIKFRYIVIVSLIISTGILLRLFSISLNPKILMYAKNKVEQSTNNIISDCINTRIKNSVDNSLLTFTKNGNNEIILVEYRLNRLYELLKDVNDDLYRMLNKKSCLLLMPIGMISDNIFVNNLGPKIPIGVRWIQNVFTNLKTKVTNYGLNNALVEVYIIININQEIIVPFEKKVEKRDYEILISSYFINGKVPGIYADGFEINSNEYVK